MVQDLRGKRLLILAGAGVHCKVVRAAREMGIYTIVTDYLEDSPAKQIADESWMLNITDVDAIVERCRARHVDGVVNFCIDPAQRPYQQICERLGLPCYGTKEQFEILTDKRKFKRYCTEHGVSVIPEYSERDVIEGRAEYPIFIKPADSRGSRGQSVCHTREEALRGLEFAKQESRSGAVVCEKFMQGHQDIASAFFVVDGEPHLVKFGDRHLGRAEDNLEKQVICTQLPSRYWPMFVDKVQENVKRMIRSLGVRFGPVFMQGFVDGDTIRYYDPAMRMPGGDYDLVLKAATGFDTVKSVIHFALTGDSTHCFGNPENSFYLNGGMGLLFSMSARPGRMAHVEGLEQLLRHPNVVYGRQIIPEGSVIPASGDILQRVVAIGAYLPDKSHLREFVEEVYNTYRVCDENGADMIVSRFVPAQD